MYPLQLALRMSAKNLSQLHGSFLVAVALTLAFSLSGCAGGGDLALTMSSGTSLVSDRALEHFQLLNQLRRAGFRCPGGTSFAPNSVELKFDCRLWRASQLHSQDMANEKYFDHTSKDGRSFSDRARAQGVQASSENIAAGLSTAQAVLEQWKKSDGHCRNMMKTDAKIFAVGYGFSQGSTYKHYWTQMFGRSTSGLDTSCLSSAGLLVHSLDVSGMASESNQTSGVSMFPALEPSLALEDAWTHEIENKTDEIANGTLETTAAISR